MDTNEVMWEAVLIDSKLCILLVSSFKAPANQSLYTALLLTTKLLTGSNNALLELSAHYKFFGPYTENIIYNRSEWDLLSPVDRAIYVESKSLSNLGFINI